MIKNISKEVKYSRTKKGLVTQMYSQQKRSSKSRGHQPPQYTKEELSEWLFNQPHFNFLYEIWKANDYRTSLKPSIDRFNNYKGYSLDNICLVAWSLNNRRGTQNTKTGIDNKQSYRVQQIDIANGNIINTFHSIMEAERRTGISNSNISLVLSGKRNKAGGFIWKRVN